MEKTFKLKLWDYSAERLNLNGRVCLKFSVLWAFLAMAHILIIHPLIFKKIMALGPYYSHFIAGALAAGFALDINYSIRSLLHFKDFQNNILMLIEKGKKFIPAFYANFDDEDVNKKLPNEIRRILKPLNAFPNLRKNFRGESFVFPKWINEILEKKFKR